MTRARKALYLTWADERMVFGNTYSSFASRFLEESGLESVPQPGSGRYAARSGNYASWQRGSTEKGRTDWKHGESSGMSYRHAPESRISSFGNSNAGNKAGQTGKRVNHPALGQGTIIAQLGSGSNAKATIKFDSGATQTFMLKFAPITYLD